MFLVTLQSMLGMRRSTKALFDYYLFLAVVKSNKKVMPLFNGGCVIIVSYMSVRYQGEAMVELGIS